MTNLKQHLIEDTVRVISIKEKEIEESDLELKMLGARLKVETKAFGMPDLNEYLKDDFRISAQVLGDMLMMEQNRNSELKKELEVLRYRRGVIESQFSDSELDN